MKPNPGLMIADEDDESALLALKRAILTNPADAEAHVRLGRTCHAAGNLEEAGKCALRALYFKPEMADGMQLLAAVLHRQKRYAEALQPALGALKRKEGESGSSELYAVIVSHLPVSATEIEARTPLERFLSRRDKAPISSALRAAVNRLIALKPEMAELTALRKNDQAVDSRMVDPAFLETLADPLLFALMQRTLMVSINTEYVLTRLRRALLLSEELRLHSAAKPWLTALWTQGFFNEYAFYAEEEENAAVEDLADRVAAQFTEGKSPAMQDIAVLGSYRLLAEMQFAPDLEQWAANHTEIKPVIEMQVTELLEERRRAQHMSGLTGVEDDTSRKVRQQYEEHPYPRWKDINRVDPMPMEAYLRTRIRFRGWNIPKIEQPKVLVAGCGTGWHACSVAMPLQAYEVMAIDLSRASLAYASKKAVMLGLKNISFMQADILQLHRLEKKFHLIECSGVLHHMHDPVAGWRQLTEVLEPGGVMKIGLYSKTARRFLVEMREGIAHDNSGKSVTEEIRTFRRKKIQEGATAQNTELFRLEDFYSISGCRDLLFHVQEQDTIIPEIGKILQDFGFRFLGFEFADYSSFEQYSHATPQDPEGLNLEYWDAFEQRNPDTFKGMYQFWLQKI